MILNVYFTCPIMQPYIMSLHKECLIINQGEEVWLIPTVSIHHKSIVYFFHTSFIEFYIKKEGVQAVTIDYVSGTNWAFIFGGQIKIIYFDQ